MLLALALIAHASDSPFHFHVMPYGHPMIMDINDALQDNAKVFEACVALDNFSAEHGIVARFSVSQGKIDGEVVREPGFLDPLPRVFDCFTRHMSIVPFPYTKEKVEVRFTYAR